jgi:hypothetical protein
LTCFNALEAIANKNVYSLNQKNYKDGKYYDDFSKVMKSNKDIMAKAHLNPSLKIFIDTLSTKFPEKESIS